MSLVRWQATIVDEAGNIQPSASITIRDTSGNLVPVWTDSAGTIAEGNPFTADGNGYAFGYVLSGLYNITASLGGFTITWADSSLMSSPFVFSTVAQLKDQSLPTGQTVTTQGYTTAGDGGGATYLIVPSQAADGFGDHVLLNGNVAVLQNSGSVNVKHFGAAGDAATDDTLYVQAAINYCLSFDGVDVNGQHLAVGLDVTGMCLLSSSLIIDRPENISNFFRVFGTGVVGGFVTTSAIDMFDSSYVGSLSQQTYFENITFSSTVSTSYVIQAENFARINFSKCFFDGIRLTKSLTVGKFVQLVLMTDCYVRNVPGKFIDAYDLYGVEVTGSIFEVVGDTVFSAVNNMVGCSFQGNLIETNQGRVWDVGNIAEGLNINGNYLENNIGRVLTVAGIAAGFNFTGNYVNTRSAAPDNRSDTAFFEISIAESQGFFGAGNKLTHRGYEFTGTGPFTASVGQGDDAGVLLVNPVNSDLIINNMVGEIKLRGTQTTGAGATLTLRNDAAGFGTQSVIEFQHGSEVKTAIRSALTATGSGAGRILFELENASNVYEEVASIDTNGFRVLTDAGLSEAFFGNVTADPSLTGKSGAQVTNNGGTYGRMNFAKSSASGTGATYLIRNYYEGAATGGLTSTNTTVALVTTSDHRLKENVVKLDNALARIAQLNPVQYSWKSSGVEDEGFVAHELQGVLPIAVTGAKDALNKDGSQDYQVVDLMKLIPTLVAAVKEQQVIIEELNNRLDSIT